MPKAVTIIIILASLLFLAIQLLFSFSYETFIPWDANFGKNIYIVYVFFLWLITEKYFYKIKEKGGNRDLYVTFPIALVFVNFVVALIIFSIFEPHMAGPGDGFALLFYVVFQSFVFLIYGILRVGFFHSSSSYDDSIFIRSAKFINTFLNKLPIIIIPLLVILIAAIVIISFNNYLSGGIRYNFSYKANDEPMLQLAIERNDISFCNEIKGHRYRVGNIGHRDAKELQKECIHSFIYKIPEVKNYNKKSSKVDFFITYNKLKNQCSKTNYYKECTRVLLKSIYPILESSTQKSLKTSWSFADTYTNVDFPENRFGNVNAVHSSIYYLMIKIIHKNGGYPADDFEFDYPVPGYDYPMYQYEVETISNTLNAFKKAQVKLKSDLKGIESVVGISDSSSKRKKTIRKIKKPNGSRDIIPGKPVVSNSYIADKKKLFSTIYIDIEKVANTKSDYEKIVTIVSNVFSKPKKPPFPKNTHRVPCKRTSKDNRRTLGAYVRRTPICIDGKLIPRIKEKNRYNSFLN